MGLFVSCLAALTGLAIAASPAMAAQTNAARAKTTAIDVTEIAKGLDHPWALQFMPDGRYLVTEKAGSMRVVAKDGARSEPIAGVPKVAAQGQGGLLDVLLAADFATSGRIFFSYAEPRGTNGSNATAVARAKLVLDETGGRLEDLSVIFRQEPPFISVHHFGSRLVLDRDGDLFVTVGERNIGRRLAQDPSNGIGKVIHITQDGQPAKSNPKLDGWQPEVWSIGHRNMQGAALHPETGKLFVTEHGPRGGDELNVPLAGKNYGWPIITYGIDYSGAPIGDGITEQDGLEQPAYYWKPSIGTSGLAFYTGDLFPDWKGNLLSGGLAIPRLERLVLDGEKVVGMEPLLVDRGDRIRDVRVGPDGAVYVLTDDDDGKILRLTPAAGHK